METSRTFSNVLEQFQKKRKDLVANLIYLFQTLNKIQKVEDKYNKKDTFNFIKKAKEKHNFFNKFIIEKKE